MTPGSVDLPSDVHSVLTQLLGEARAAAAERDVATVADAVASVESVATNKVPESEVRERLLHGCAEVERLLAGLEPPLAPDERGRITITVEYLRSMETLLEDEESA